VLQTLVVEDDVGLAWVTVAPGALERYNATPDDLDGIVEFPRSIAGVRMALLFRQIANGRIKCRSGPWVPWTSPRWPSSSAGRAQEGGRRVARFVVGRGAATGARGRAPGIAWGRRHGSLTHQPFPLETCLMA